MGLRAAPRGSPHWSDRGAGSCPVQDRLASSFPCIAADLLPSRSERKHDLHFQHGSRSARLLHSGAGEVRIVGTTDNAFWVKLAPDVAMKLRKAVRRVNSIERPPRRLRSASTTDLRHARPPIPPLRIGRPTTSAPNGIHWLYISLLGASPSSPWTDGRNVLWVSRRGHNYLKRDGETVRIRRRSRHAFAARRRSLSSSGGVREHWPRRGAG